MKKALLIIAQTGYQDKELAGTRDGLEAAGFSVELASPDGGLCSGKFGGEEHAIAMSSVDIDAYDRVAFIGGPGAGALASHPDALHIAQAAHRAGLPVGAICIAPTVLAKAHILEGREATVWPSDDAIVLLEQYGATYTGHPVTVDGDVITGNGPDAAVEFGEKLAKL